MMPAKDKILVTGGSGFIGMNLCQRLVDEGFEFVNLDVAPPPVKSFERFWKQTDLADEKQVIRQVGLFKPDAVIHLAARTDTDSNVVADYAINYTGTASLIRAIQESGSVKRVVFASTQFVHQYHGDPKHDEDFAPHTAYGESKVMAEKLIRQAALACAWTIIRPTNVWGPWHPRYAREFWLQLKLGRYFHPGVSKPVIRSYGFVGNVVDQVFRILDAPRQTIDSKVFYVGDEPMDIRQWVGMFSRKLLGRDVRVIPAPLVRLLAIGGDILKLAGIRFPITSSRFKSMTTSNVAPMEATFRTFGKPAYDLEQGVEATVHWLISLDPAFWSPKRK